jgi:hypothetical protein
MSNEGPRRLAAVWFAEVVLDQDDDLRAELGPSVAQMIASELETAGLSTQYLWTLAVGFTGESAYGRVEQAGLGAGAAPAHALFGRLAVREGQVALSAQVSEIRTGAVAGSGLATGTWPDALFDVVEDLGATLAGKLAPPGTSA